MLAKCRLKALALELWEEPGPCAFYLLTLFHLYTRYNYGRRLGRVGGACTCDNQILGGFQPDRSAP